MNGDHPHSTSYSLIPCADDGVHAVWDWMIRAAYHDPGLGKPRAVCGVEVRPVRQLPAPEAVCADCRAALPPDAIPRPAPGSPMLRDLARLHARMTR